MFHAFQESVISTESAAFSREAWHSIEWRACVAPFFIEMYCGPLGQPDTVRARIVSRPIRVGVRRVSGARLRCIGRVSGVGHCSVEMAAPT